MKKLLSLLVIIFLMACYMPQTASAQSGVVLDNYWFEFGSSAYCPETGLIVFTGEVHQLTKLTPIGVLSVHYNAHGEGVDESGGEWTWIDAWNTTESFSDYQETRVLTLQGPKGAKLQMKIVFIVKDGETVVDKFEPLCE